MRLDIAIEKTTAMKSPVRGVRCYGNDRRRTASPALESSRLPWDLLQEGVRARCAEHVMRLKAPNIKDLG